MSDGSDEGTPQQLGYAPSPAEPVPASPVDMSVGITSGLQVTIANAVAASYVVDGGRVGALFVAGLIAYIALSAVALAGSIFPTWPRRRPFYRTYLVGVVAGTATVTVMLGLDVPLQHLDPSGLPVVVSMALIANPTWIVLVVRGVNRPPS